MKKLALLFTFLTSFILPAACNKSVADSNVYIPVRNEDNGVWFFVDENGNRVSDETFEKLPSIAYDGIFSIANDNGLDVFRLYDGKITPINNLQNLYACGAYSDGLLPVVRHGEGIVVTDDNGVEKFRLNDVVGEEVLSCNTAFHNGILVFTTLHGLGAVNSDGKVVVAPSYDGMSDFNEDIALAWNYAEKTDYSATIRYSIVDVKGDSIPVKGTFGQLYNDGEGYHIPMFKNGIVQVNDRLTANERTGTGYNIEISNDGTSRQITPDEAIYEESVKFPWASKYAEISQKEIVSLDENKLFEEIEFSVPQIHSNTRAAWLHMKSGEFIMGETIISPSGLHLLFAKGGKLYLEDESGIHSWEGDGFWEQSGKAIVYLIEGTNCWSIIGGKEYNGSYNPKTGRVLKEYWDEVNEGLDTKEFRLDEVESHTVPMFRWYAGELK